MINSTKQPQVRSDSEAAILANQYKEHVITLTRRYLRRNFCGPLDEPMAESFALQALDKATKTYDPQRSDSFEAFLGQLVERALKTARVWASRRKNTIPTRSLDELIYTEGDTPIRLKDSIRAGRRHEPHSTVITQLDYSEAIKLLEVLLSELEFKAYVSLHRDQLSHKEIAEELGVKLKSVDNACQRASRKINAAIARGILSLD